MTTDNYVMDYYAACFQRHGDSPQGADCRDRNAQDGRLCALLSHSLPRYGASILDVGCGTGRLLELMGGESFNRYLGVDFVGAAVERARAKFSGDGRAIFSEGPLQSIAGSFQTVVASGIFNVRGAFSDALWEEHLRRTVAQMRRLCHGEVLFNALSTRCDRREDRLYYLNPARVRDLFCAPGFHTELLPGHGTYDIVVRQRREGHG